MKYKILSRLFIASLAIFGTIVSSACHADYINNINRDFGSCGTNNEPLIQGVYAESSSIQRGESVVIECIASDPDDD